MMTLLLLVMALGLVGLVIGMVSLMSLHKEESCIKTAGTSTRVRPPLPS